MVRVCLLLYGQVDFGKKYKGVDVMKMTIVGRKYTPDDKFKQRAEKKLAKIERFFGEDAEAKITVTLEKYRHIVEITVIYSKMYFRAQESASDVIEALDKTIDKLIGQIRKNKTKLEKRLRQGAFDDFAVDSSIEEEREFRIVRTKRIPVKPLSVEEAILEMNMLDHQFYMFLNDETNQINVVYKRYDGGYGILEPDIF